MRPGSHRGSKGSPCGIVGAGAAGRTGGRIRGTSAAVGWRSRATMSVSAATWLVRADSVEEAEAAEALSSPISPVTWENADESSELSFVSCAEWLRTTPSRAGVLGLGISSECVC